MTNRLAGKTALITAAAQGIGRTTAAFFARQGATVIATDIRTQALQDFTEGQVYTLDVTDKHAILDLKDKIPTPDVLFNCAGVVHNGTILDCTDDDFDFACGLNMRAMYMMIQAFLPAMIENGGASIINMASIASSVKGIPNRFAYTATKAGVIGITKSVAQDFVLQGIRCNAICPGTVDSPSLQQRIKDLPGDYQQNYQSFIDRQPMQRIGTTAEIAHLAVYLASDESAFTTGAVHVIDGGWVN